MSWWPTHGKDAVLKRCGLSGLAGPVGVNLPVPSREHRSLVLVSVATITRLESGDSGHE